jgi:hypothetical protein
MRGARAIDQKIQLLTGNHIVIAIDIRSSSKMLEYFKDHRKPVDPYIALIMAMKHKIDEFPGCIAYKFTGDGWIVLFKKQKTNGSAMLQFMEALSKWYATHSSNLVKQMDLPRHGLTFGVDDGWIWEVPPGFFEQTEYIGEPIVLASRLQAAAAAAVGESADSDYAAFISVPCFNGYFKGIASDAMRTAVRLGKREDDDPCMILPLASSAGSAQVPNPTA